MRLACFFVLLAGVLPAQPPDEVLDVYIARVKPDKRSAYEAATMAEFCGGGVRTSRTT